MAEVSAELVYEVLNSLQHDMMQVDGKLSELKQTALDMQFEITAIHHDLTGIHSELGSIHATLIRHEHRLDRIEHRLELNEAPSLT